MTASQTPDVTQDVQPPAAPAGLNLLGDANAGNCCGGHCALPSE
ncbi:hypothetical protein HD600_002149 [Microbacterium ginsengiterrae]|uniref:Uncharacterized protein n=1 Tax=Microbacterium ginsengiterrae TaxID=546115 RepID=A0A7W9FBY9_9MICO|nr:MULTISPECIES: hypothetical protein [Microbacterium]MBB5743652.1 hypothetical protein [Microbacterium ginsengiterrae]